MIRCYIGLLASLVPQLVCGVASARNPVFVMSFAGEPCGVVIEGPPGASLDDGTGGLPFFEQDRPGYDLDVVLTMANVVEQLWQVDGYTWGIGVEGPLLITDTTLNGSVTCDNGPQCLGGTGLYRTYLTGLPYGAFPPFTAENHGVSGQAVLTLQQGGVPGVGEYVICKIRVSGTFPVTPGEEVVGRVLFAPRVFPNGPLIRAGVTYIGSTDLLVTAEQGFPPLTELDCPIILRAAGPIDSFIRCDATDDGKLDLSDAVRILGELFLGSEHPVRCVESMDCNADGVRDVSDAIYALLYLYLGSPPPPAPFPECGQSEETTEESCPGATTQCP